MEALSYCLDCDKTVNIDTHFDDDGLCQFYDEDITVPDIREVLDAAAKRAD